MPTPDGDWSIELPSYDELHRRFEYDPLTGVLMNKVGRFSGQPAGPLRVRVGKDRLRIHRIAWKMMTGEEPPDYIDHADLDHTNMRWVNLRAADASKNQQNRRALPRKLNVPRGVYPYGTNRWVVFYVVKGKKIHYYKGSNYKTACDVSYAAARELHGEFFRDHREDFDDLYGYREPEREWHPDGPFVNNYLSTSSRKDTSKPGYLRQDGTPKGVYKYGTGWCVMIWHDKSKNVHYRGPDKDEADRIAIDIHRRLYNTFEGEGGLAVKKLGPPLLSFGSTPY